VSDTPDGAAWAAWYWRNLNRACDDAIAADSQLLKCSAVAGEFLDRSLGPDYFKRYKQGLAGRRPAIWAFHPYQMGPNRSFALYDRFADHLPAAPGGGQPAIWLTEAGGVYQSAAGKTRRDANLVRQDVQCLINDLVNHDSRIKRFYYYAWTGEKDGFDSGLISPFDNHARLIYFDYRTKTNPTASTS
jgi:hypothetical protein